VFDGIEQQILNHLEAHSIVRPRDLLRAGIATAPLTALVRRGAVIRVGRGLYMLPDAGVTEHHSLAVAASAVPHGVVCLLSALRFHELGTQNPHQVWIAIHRQSRRPVFRQPALACVRFSGPALELGIEEHVIEGVVVRVYSAAKSVVDCFRYRNKLGLDVAIEALKDFLGRGGSPDQLWKTACACRAARVIQPYIEALL